MFRLLGMATVFLVIGVVAGLYGFGVISEGERLGAKLLSAFFLWVAAGAFWWARMMRTGFYETPYSSSNRNPETRSPRLNSPSGDAT